MREELINVMMLIRLGMMIMVKHIFFSCHSQFSLLLILKPSPLHVEKNQSSYLADLNKQSKKT